jgi:hypothetical protein
MDVAARQAPPDDPPPDDPPPDDPPPPYSEAEVPPGVDIVAYWRKESASESEKNSGVRARWSLQTTTSEKDCLTRMLRARASKMTWTCLYIQRTPDGGEIPAIPATPVIPQAFFRMFDVVEGPGGRTRKSTTRTNRRG